MQPMFLFKDKKLKIFTKGVRFCYTSFIVPQLTVNQIKIYYKTEEQLELIS